MCARKMNQAEAWAKDYLVYRGFKEEDIDFEPDGNMTPDFLLENRIAVEVRRLNQHWQGSSEDDLREPVEKLSMPLLIRLRRLLEAFGSPENGVSWYVSHKFQRPQLTTNWEPILRKRLQPFQQGKIQDRENVIRIDDHFSVRLLRCPEPGASNFVWSGVSDFNQGGWVIPELEKNLAICIAEKSGKIAPHRRKYPEWWLVLVDYMMGGSPETVCVEHDWDKVLVIHPSNYGWAYEVPGSKSAGRNQVLTTP